MSILWNEFSALYRRKQFLLLSAVLFIFGLAALFLYERNTEEYYYLFQEKEGTAEWYEAREAASEAYLSEYEIFLTGMEGRAEQIRNSGRSSMISGRSKVTLQRQRNIPPGLLVYCLSLYSS